jgi:hypothetical protein
MAERRFRGMRLSSRNRRVGVRLDIDGVGFFLNDDHAFSTARLGDTSIKRMKEELSSQGFSPEIVGAGFDVIQVRMPIGEAYDEKGNFRLPGRFKKGYMEQARWRYGPPGTKVLLDDLAEEIFGRGERIGSLYREFLGDVGRETAGKHRSYATRIRNQRWRRIREAIEKGRADFGGVDAGIAGEIIALQNDFPGAEVDDDLDIHLRDGSGFDFGYPPSPEEVRGYNWCILDIEKPRFGEDGEEISWVTALYTGTGLKELHTLRDPPRDEYGGFVVHRYGSEKELLEGFLGTFGEQDPEIVAAHNAAFDLSNIKKAIVEGHADVGLNPKKEVWMKFFERMRLDGRQVVDTMHYFRNGFFYLPDKKLGTVRAHILGVPPEKRYSYDELRELEKLAVIGDSVAADHLAEYAVDDVGPLAEVIKRTGIVECILPVCGAFGVEYGTCITTPNSVKNMRKREYFDVMGTTPEITQSTIKENERRRGVLRNYKSRMLKEALGPCDAVGFRENVTVAVVPWGDYLRRMLYERFPQLEGFFSQKYRHLQDTEMQVVQSAYAGVFAEDMLLDHVHWDQLEWLSRIENRLARNMKGETPEEKSRSFWRVHHLKERTMRLETLKKYVKDDIESDIRSRELTPGKFYELLKRYRNLPEWTERAERVMIGRNGVSPSQLENTLKIKMGKVKRFAEENGLDIVYCNKDMIFFEGGFGGAAPIIVVGQVPVLLTGGPPIYRMDGRYANVRIKKAPTDKKNVYMMRLHQEFLDTVFDGRLREALDFMDDEQGRFSEGTVGVEDIVYCNRSSGVHSVYEVIPKGAGRRKTWFCTGRDPGEGEPDGETGRRYIHDIENNMRVYLLGSLDELNPDYGFYRKKMFGSNSETGRMVMAVRRTLGKET